MKTRLVALLESPGLPWLAALVGVLLCLPALGVGLIADDWYHRGLLLGLPEFGSGKPLWLELFAFMPDAERNAALMERGILPWWSDPELKAAFFRPLSVLTHWLDYRLWPDAVGLQHLHSLAWYGLSLVAVGAVFRRLFGVGLVAGLATLLFAVDDSHAMAVGWIANRNALVALALGAWALSLHLGGRRGPALLVFAAALCAGESALGAAAYVVAWELTGPGTAGEASWRRRLGRLLPWTLLVVAWRLVYQWLGLGAAHSDLYVDPGRTPLDFLVALAERGPLLAAGQVFGAPVDLWLFATRPVQILGSALAALGVVGLGWALAGWLRGEPRARFLALGGVLSLVPLCAVFPTDRLLLWPGLGAFGLLALLVSRVGWLAPRPADRPLSARVLVGGLLALHLPLAGLMLPVRVAMLPAYGSLFSHAALNTPFEPAYNGRTLVLLNGQELMAAYAGVIREVARDARVRRGLDPAVMPVPARVHLLGSFMTGRTVGRVDAHTLEVVPEGGMLATAMDRLFWDPSRRFAAGEVVARGDMQVEILDLTDDGRPARVRYRFERDLDDPGLVWRVLVDGELQPWAPPAVGQAVHIDASIPPLQWKPVGPLLVEPVSTKVGATP